MVYQLPSLAELHAATYEDVAKDDSVLAFLNQEPPAQWIKYHPTVKVKNEQNQSVPLAYLPIDKVELLMTTIFRKWRPEIVKVEPMFNSIVVTTRIHFLWPGTENDWRSVDGVGAQGIQTDAGAGAADISKMKFSAVQIAAPAAYSFAKKDACENIGRVFGRDLNKHGVISFEPFAPEKAAPKEIKQDVPEMNTTPSQNVAPIGNFGTPDFGPAAPVAQPQQTTPPAPQPGNFAPIQF